MKTFSALLLSLTLISSLAATAQTQVDETNSVQSQAFGPDFGRGPGPGPGGFGPGHGPGGFGPGHGGGGWGPGPGHDGPGHGGWGPGPGGPPPGPASTQVSCQSLNHAPAVCESGFRVATSIRLIQQYSSAGCSFGNDFNLNPNSGSFWVSNGCRGLFEVEGF